MGAGLNFLDLILEASLLVQLVMLALVAMSVMSW
ncbi:MAG: Tol-Pal system subunit TolQ, partial [Pseudoalteromonas sp.]